MTPKSPAGSTIGTVCERVVRRANIDVFVAKDRHRVVGDGPIVVGMDGSPKSFGALKTAIDIGRRLDTPVHVVAEETIMWSDEAEEKIGRAPDFVRGIARTSVIRQAQAKGHTFITSRFVDEVMAAMMPGGGDPGAAVQQGFDRLQRVPEAFRASVRSSVEAFAGAHGATEIAGEIAEAAFVDSRKAMCPVDHDSPASDPKATEGDAD